MTQDQLMIRTNVPSMTDKKHLIQLAHAILDEQIPREKAMSSLTDLHFHKKSNGSQVIHLLYHFLNDKDIRDKDFSYAEAQKENINKVLKFIK